MKLLATIAFFSAFAAAAPVLDARATTTAKTSSALKTSSAAAVKSSSAAAVVTAKSSSAAVVSKASSSAVVSKASSSAIVSKVSSAASSVITSKASSAAATTTGTAPLLGVNVGGSSSPLLGVKVSSSTLLAVDVSLGASSVKASSVATITAAPTSAPATASTALPSTFSAPVQGQGKLTLDNLPAMPGVIDKAFSGVLGAAYGLMSGACDSSYKCNITVAGTLNNLLIDGNNYGTNTSVAAWCDGGRCYGAASAPLSATAPFIITCDQLSGTQVCSATISGAANAIFQNGESVELWGWLTPAGYCQNGVCTASITAVGDPMY
ncbi:uncharacterized protein J4E78_004920 [Alternaria triticimaculans]|uniref:uncharacterized protein n=1 Tax=Alternaria triticimaculans TaxID=297637 RepID=UPI0020C3B9E8|nr:uncharacterized protein J4E78_004920 [Alternaria triticimaculans]KAI4660220.1 hypothetical protein J4E78_004920 [Alternaria triticimaculans]